jgi:hypothetical protein
MADGKFPSQYDDSIKTEDSLIENPTFKEWWERCSEKYKSFAAATKLGLLESEEVEASKDVKKLGDGFSNEEEIVKAIELNGFRKLPPTRRGGDYVFLDPSRSVKYVSNSSGYVRYYDPTAKRWWSGQPVTTKTPIHRGLIKSPMDRLVIILRRAMKSNNTYNDWKKSGLSGKDFMEKNKTRLTAKSIGLLEAMEEEFIGVKEVLLIRDPLKRLRIRIYDDGIAVSQLHANHGKTDWFTLDADSKFHTEFTGIGLTEKWMIENLWEVFNKVIDEDKQAVNKLYANPIFSKWWKESLKKYRGRLGAKSLGLI